MIKSHKQLIINIITIINIIAILIFSYYLYINNKYSRSKIYALLEKNSNNINYSIEIEDSYIEENRTVFKKIIQKENARKEENINDKHVTWYTNDIVIVHTTGEKYYYKEPKEITDTNGNTTKGYSTTADHIRALRNEFNIFTYLNTDAEYKYLKKENFNNQKCIVIELTDNKANPPIDIKAWINSNNGFIEKEELYFEGKLQRVVKYTIKVNCITDEEIGVPEITEYNFLNERNNF